jgi:hypothetical protein
MNIQDLVPDLSICQEAKDKGVVIESSFWWKKTIDSSRIEKHYNQITGTQLLYGNKYIIREASGDYPAPLTDEILPKLPNSIIKDTVKDEERFYLEIIKLDDDSFSASYANEKHGFYYNFEDKKLSNALLLLAIKLKEEGII